MTLTGTQPKEIRPILEAYEKHKGDPSVEAQLVELHARMEDEFMKLRADTPEASQPNIRFDGEKHALFERVKVAREAIRGRKFR